MSIHGKSALIIMCTLLIGIAIGMFLVGPVAHRRLRPDPRWRGPEAFAPILERVVNPTPDQREAVRAVLEKHADRIAEMHTDYRSEMTAVMDSLRKDLDPILTDEQKARLDERHDHFRDFMKGRRGPHGKPHGKPHGNIPG
jgi:hypothetical protein